MVHETHSFRNRLDGYRCPSVAAQSDVIGPMNDAFTRNAVGIVAQTRGEVALRKTYWDLWAEKIETAFPEGDRGSLIEGLSPDGTAKAVAWHEAAADKTWDKPDIEMLERRVRDLRKAKAGAQDSFAKWQGDKSAVGFFATLGGCGTR